MDIQASGIFPLSTVILPPGSTTADLQSAINSAVNGDIIEISSNMAFSSAVTIPAGLAIEIRSSAGNTWTLNYTAAANRHFLVNGTLSLANIVLYGGTTFNPDGSVLTAGAGGVQVAGGGELFLRDGAIIQNCYATDGGGVNSASGAIVAIEGGIVRLNAASNGGGIFASGAVILQSGEINNNRAGIIGGGIYFYASSQSVELIGGRISGNRAVGNAGIGGSGGGVYAYQISSVINLYGTEISGNAAINGGGIMSSGTVNMLGGSITANTATYGGGGYISGYSMSGPLGAWVLDDGVISGNSATNGGGLYARGNFPGTSVTINGGEIVDNRADRGGGVYLAWETGGGDIFVMNNGRIGANTATYNGGGVYAASGASVTFNGGVIGGASILDGNQAGSGGGFYVTGAPSALFINGGVIAFNSANTTSFGGGGVLLDGSSLTMTDGIINGNTTVGSGGGIYIYNNVSFTGVTTNTFSFEGGEISGNNADRSGGGAYLEALNNNMAVMIMLNGLISGNTASSGGGVYASSNGSIDMLGGSISGNTAASNGGGIFVSAASTFTTSGETFITGNVAGGDGGGIYTLVPDYGNLLTGPLTVFEGNTASAAYAPPPDASAQYPSLQFARVSVANHPLNNYDINFTSGDPLRAAITISPNGGTGDTITADVPFGTPYTIPSPADLNIHREGYTFTQWNTQPDGTGTAYAPGQVITITGDLTLYAQWQAIVVPCPPCPPCNPCNPCNPCACSRCRPCSCSRCNPCNPCARVPFASCAPWFTQAAFPPYAAYHGPSTHRMPYGNVPYGIYRQPLYPRNFWLY